MNDLVVESRYVIPIVNRPTVAALARRLRAPLSGFSTDLYLLQDWYMEA
jgi:peptide/nickel transport system substrate-binding protein